jgi:hypothetical protein
MIYFYSRFLPSCAHVVWSLTILLKGGTKTLEWTDAEQEAYQNAKRLLVTVVHSNILPPMLMPPTPTWEASCNKNQETIGVVVFS